MAGVTTDGHMLLAKNHVICKQQVSSELAWYMEQSVA